MWNFSWEVTFYKSVRIMQTSAVQLLPAFARKEAVESFTLLLSLAPDGMI